jgi:hypothetical protein
MSDLWNSTLLFRLTLHPFVRGVRNVDMSENSESRPPPPPAVSAPPTAEDEKKPDAPPSPAERNSLWEIALSVVKKAWPQLLAGSLMAAPVYFEISHYVAGLIFWAMGAAGILGMLGEIYVEVSKGRTGGHRIASWIGILVGAAFLGLVAWHFWPTNGAVAPGVYATDAAPNKTTRDTSHEPNKQDELPDVTLRFASPLSPTVALVNQSNALAKNVMWSVVLWNMDDPRTYINPKPEPDVHDPLPIPSTNVEFLRPHTIGGPQSLFTQAPIYSYVKSGQRLAGSASVICGECARGHTYIVSIVFGEGGWYAEQKDKKEGELIVPMTGKEEAVKAYYQSTINIVPQADRVPIGP